MQERLQHVKALVTESCPVLLLDLSEDPVDLIPRSLTSFGEMDYTRAATLFGGGPSDVAELLEAAQELVHSLLAYAGARGELTGAAALRAWILENGDMGETEAGETGLVQVGNETPMDRL